MRQQNPKAGPRTVDAPTEDVPEELPTLGWGARIVAVLKIAAGVLLVVGAAAAVAWGAYHYAVTSPRFSLRKVTIEGEQRLTVAELRRQAGLVRGVNVFALDPRVVEKKLLENPWIVEAKATRQLPDGYKVELRERQAAALLTVSGTLTLVGRDGEPFKHLQAGDPVDLPVITGVGPNEIARDRRAAIERLKLALRVLRHYRRLSVAKVHSPEEVHLAADGTVVLSVGRDGIGLHLGKGPWRKKLMMAERVLQRLQARGQQPGVVFLDNEAHPERVVARLR